MFRSNSILATVDMFGLYLGIAVALGGALAQSTILWDYRFFGVHADLVLVCVLCWGIVRGFDEGATWAIIGGMAVDLGTIAPFGVSSVGFVLAVLLTAPLANRIQRHRPIFALIAIPVGVVVHYLIAGLIMALRGYPLDPIGFGITVLLPAVILNTCVAALLLPTFAWASEQFQPTTWTSQ